MQNDEGEMGKMNGLSNTMAFLARVNSWVSSAIIAVLMVFITFSIVSRSLGYPVSGDVEIVQLSLVLLIMASLAYTEFENKHISIGLLVDHFPKSIQQVLDIINSILTFIVGLAIATAFYKLAFHELSQSYWVSTSLLKIPLFPLKFFVSLGFLMWAVQAIFKIVHMFVNHAKNENKEVKPESLGG